MPTSGASESARAISIMWSDRLRTSPTPRRIPCFPPDCALRFKPGSGHGCLPQALPKARGRSLSCGPIAYVLRRRREGSPVSRQIVLSGLSLAQATDAYLRRFRKREGDLYHVVRSLTYFADAEKDPLFPA